MTAQDCPNCKKRISHLRALITQTYQVKLVDDWEEREKKELGKADKWPTANGKALGYIRQKQATSEYKFFCPLCNALLFIEPTDALTFLVKAGISA